MRGTKKLQLCLVIIIMLAIAATVSAANIVSWQMVKQGTTEPLDTLYVGGNYQLLVSLENDFRLFGIAISPKLTSEGNAAWQWNNPKANDIPGSRMDGAWDMTGFLITEGDVDNISPDIILVGGVALSVGMDVGPLEPMFVLNFSADVNGVWEQGVVGSICVDTGMVPPAAMQNIYVYQDGSAFHPGFPGPTCWPVVMICGNPNGDDDINVGDPVFMINHIFRGGAAPNPYMLGDANLDDAVNVADVVFLINSAFRTGPNPDCPE